MARAGETERPPVPGPNRLVPYIRFAKYPPKALEVTRRVLDEDPEFRARVLDAVDLDRVGAAGRLLLEQPDGWQVALAALEVEAVDGEAEAKAARQERRATKQLVITKDMLEQATSQASDEAANAARWHADLESERAARRDLERELHERDVLLGQLRDDRQRAVVELKATEARLAERVAEVKDLQRRLDDLEVQRVAASEPSSQTRSRTDAVVAAVPPEPSVDKVALGGAVVAAVDAAAELRRALGAAAELLDLSIDNDPDRGAAGRSGARDGRVRASGGTRSAGRRRRPTRLPIGVFDDSVEAADALFAVSDMLVFVDGYNVTLAGWPDLPLDVQRSRLIDGLSVLEARTKTSFVVIFDGAEQGRHLPPESRLRSVQVRFTEPGVEADDALLEAVDGTSPARPVTVVSSDNRVRRGAESRGANTVHSGQLLAVLRR